MKNNWLIVKQIIFQTFSSYCKTLLLRLQWNNGYCHCVKPLYEIIEEEAHIPFQQHVVIKGAQKFWETQKLSRMTIKNLFKV